jgi:hypothetical protein
MKSCPKEAEGQTDLSDGYPLPNPDQVKVEAGGRNVWTFPSFSIFQPPAGAYYCLTGN